jgi:alpha-glucoside transport system permease protein
VSAGQTDVKTPTTGRAGSPEGTTRGARHRRRHITGYIFLAPALVFLGAYVVYPLFYTIVRSTLSRGGDEFVGLANYGELFTSPETLIALRNNALWVILAPAVVTALGLVFAVLTERVRWSTAFKTVIFLPMAISFLAVGIIFRLVYEETPERGLLNAAVEGVVHVFQPPGDYPGARPTTDNLEFADGAVRADGVEPGSPVLLGLEAIDPSLLPGTEEDAVAEPPASDDAVTGVVWRDFSAGGEPGTVDEGELGLPGVRVTVLDSDGDAVGEARTEADGSFSIGAEGEGPFTVELDERNFREPFGGIAWLGPALVTPAVIASFVWMWAGFAMMVIAAGLASIPRETIEAARVDGGTEWQMFRKVLAPQLAPVLLVVFVTLMINVLKIFDLVLVVPPGSSQDDATVLALEMWRVAFGGPQDFGLGSAIAVFLFLLVVPAMAFNIRRFRLEEER